MNKREIVQEKIIEQFRQDTRLDGSKIKIEVESNGNIILSGSVPTSEMTEFAQEDALQINEVDSVTNQLTIERKDSHHIPSDKEIKHTILQQKLWNNLTIDDTDIDFEVEGGVVTLRGKVNELWKKIEVEEIIANIYGVERVINEVSVVGENPKDSTLARSIMNKLEKNPNVDPDDIDLVVNNNKVKISGVLPSDKTKEEIKKELNKISTLDEWDDKLVVEEDIENQI